MIDPFFKFIHLTDPHIIASSETLFGKDVGDHLVRAIESINRNFGDAELCMITGDLAHWGEAHAYAKLKEILAELKMPWHLLMGNHDARVAARDTFPELPWSEDGFLHYRMDTPAGVFLVLDTVDDGNNNGRLCESRLRWLRQQLLETQAAGDDVFLFMHHPPMDIGIHSMNLVGMANPEDLIAVLQGSRHVRHMFFGHLHRTCHGSWRGIPFSTVKATCYQVELRLDGSDVLSCSHEHPAYAVALINKDSVVIHDHSYMEEGKAFSYDRGAPKGGDKPEHQRAWS